MAAPNSPESIMEVDEGFDGAEDPPCDVEADEDEEDPLMVDCPACGTSTHVSFGKCSKVDCGREFKFTKSGHLLDGFVVGEDEVEYCEDEEEEESEAEYEDSEEESDEDEEECPWGDEDESDGSWEP